jgi:hypothetical protein
MLEAVWSVQELLALVGVVEAVVDLGVVAVRVGPVTAVVVVVVVAAAAAAAVVVHHQQ